MPRPVWNDAQRVLASAARTAKAAERRADAPLCDCGRPVFVFKHMLCRPCYYYAYRRDILV